MRQEGGNWIFLYGLLPVSRIEEIKAAPIVTQRRLNDVCYRGFERSRTFTVSSAHGKFASSNIEVNGEDNLGWVWHLRCPDRIRLFVWLAALDKLNANQVSGRRHMTSNISSML